MQQPAYEIVVDCRLGNEWKGRVGTMSISEVWKCGSASRTVLRGRPRDRAELAGIIQNLYDHGVNILRVEQFPVGSDEDEQG